MSDDAEIAADNLSEQAWLPLLTWPLLSLLSWLMFELTAEPAFSAVVLCCKFGWEDLQTGLWMRRTDPNAGRGAACFWFSLMVGVFHVFMAAGVVTGIIMGLLIWWDANAPAPAGAQNPSSAIQALVGLICAAELLLMLLGLRGCALARRHKIKVWISPMLHRARRAEQWPPGDPSDADGKNDADVCLMPAIAIGVLAIALVAIGLIFDMNLPASIVVTLALGVAVYIVWLPRGATAETFGDCWPEATSPPVMSPG